MVLGLGLGSIGKGICFCFDLLYTYHVFWAFWKKKKTGVGNKTGRLGVWSYLNLILIF
jgi:hypothetical protein